MLDSQPTADVTVAYHSGDNTLGTVSPASLTFGATNWSSPQTVTVTGVVSAVARGNTSYDIAFDATQSTDTQYAAITPPSVPVTSIDTNTPQILVGAPSGPTSEAGGQATISVVLTSQPTDDVTVNFASDTPTEGVTDVTSLTFTPVDYATPQTITVTGQPDQIADGNQPYAVTFTATTSNDPVYAAITPLSVGLTNLDVDSAGITVSAADGPTTSVGGTALFTVVLHSEPTQDVTVRFDTSDATRGTPDVTSLTFTTTTWNTPQTVAVTGHDAYPGTLGSYPYQIAFTATTSGDTGYAGLVPAPVSMVNEQVAAPPAAPNVLLLAADAPGGVTSVQSALLAAGGFTGIDTADGVTPTLATLQTYDAVLVWNYELQPWADATALGNVLADYADGGGRVVVAGAAEDTKKYPILGRFGDPANGYVFMSFSDYSLPTVSLGTVEEPASPLMVGVTSLSTTDYTNTTGPGPINGGVTVASWNTGTALVVRGYGPGGTARVDLNVIPEAATGDGTALLRNALLYNPPRLFAAPSYAPVETFPSQVADGSSQVGTGLAWDGASLWDAAGGTTLPIAAYSSTGVAESEYPVGLNVNSLFTKGEGTGPVYACTYGSAQILVQTSAGVIANDVVLSPAPAGAQEAVVFDTAQREFIGISDGASGIVQRWDETGSPVDPVQLQGWGTDPAIPDEDSSPCNRSIATTDGLYLTYCDGTLSAWSAIGVRVRTTQLESAPPFASTTSNYSLSVAFGKVWLLDVGGADWLGYDVGLP